MKVVSVQLLAYFPMHDDAHGTGHPSGALQYVTEPAARQAEGVIPS